MSKALRKPMHVDEPDWSLMQQLSGAGIGVCPTSGMPVLDPAACAHGLRTAIWRAYCGVARRSSDVGATCNRRQRDGRLYSLSPSPRTTLLRPTAAGLDGCVALTLSYGRTAAGFDGCVALTLSYPGGLSGARYDARGPGVAWTVAALVRHRKSAAPTGRPRSPLGSRRSRRRPAP